MSVSLHGLILADALGIPSLWVGDDTLLGDAFKFRDYASSVARGDWTPAGLNGTEKLSDIERQLTLAPQEKVLECQDKIEASYRDMANRLGVA